ncbi:hypothetical protein NIES4075_73160 [Tolypothrix sp. NIES-4075]|uniref:hypothetical protein n=1 Tax=Tolypothrix sp. NIES-4075 TaxID=2005459 RepID=UPI000B5C2A27|nr:hypothetical protein [Tolypothrix sp. NIES-4075]GAX46295.1 hypothetical protein NIES4075_73160 [Tolypothrix sp. NIES-4075]
MSLPILHKVTLGAGKNTYYFKTSDAYQGIKTVVGIEKVADPTGTEEVVAVKELLRTGVLWRIGIRYKDSGGKRKSAHLLVANTKLAEIFGENAAGKLEDNNYQLGTTVKGKIDSIAGRRKASFS